MFKITSFTLIIGFIFHFHSKAQHPLKAFANEDGVKIEYQWKSIKKNKNKVLELCFEVTNTNDYPVELLFNFNITRNKEEKSKSGDIKKCLKPKKMIRGRKKGLNFMIEDITAEDVNSDKFELLLGELEVKKVTKCKK